MHIFTGLQLLLIALKATGYINWSWVIVLLPLGIYMVFLLSLIVFGLVLSYKIRKREKESKNRDN